MGRRDRAARGGVRKEKDLKDQRTLLRADIEAWRSAAMQKRLTWPGLFGGGRAE